MVEINFWAVLVAAIVNMVVGYVWYGPLFGKMWKDLMGFTDESMQSMKVKSNTAMAMGLVTALVMAYVLAYFAGLGGFSGLLGAWNLAFWVWLGFVATILAGSFIWEGRPLKLFVLNAVEQLVAIFLMAAVIVLWM